MLVNVIPAVDNILVRTIPEQMKSHELRRYACVGLASRSIVRLARVSKVNL